MRHLPIAKAAIYLIYLGAVCVLLAGFQVLRWSLDYMPPFALFDYTSNPAKPGEVLTIKANVRRDLDRRCSVHYSRSFFDSLGTRFDMTSEQFMNAGALDELNKKMPDKLVLTLAVPRYAAAGKGVVMVVLDYKCNPLQAHYPISMILMMNVEVL